MPLPVADEGIAGFLQRSENRRNSVSPNDSPGTARRKRRFVLAPKRCAALCIGTEAFPQLISGRSTDDRGRDHPLPRTEPASWEHSDACEVPVLLPCPEDGFVI